MRALRVMLPASASIVAVIRDIVPSSDQLAAAASHNLLTVVSNVTTSLAILVMSLERPEVNPDAFVRPVED